jgi:hypothetical protein
MFAKSVGVCLMLVASTGLGCAVSAEEEAATSTVSSNLSPPDDGVAPPRFEPMIPAFPALDPQMGRPVWDIQRYIREERSRPFDFSYCWQYVQKIYDPSRGRDVEIPVTVCN